MKNYIKYIIPIILIIILSILIIIVYSNVDLDNSCYSKINIDDLYLEINSFNNNKFNEVVNGTESLYLQIDFSKAQNYLLASDLTGTEFLAIFYKLQETEIEYLKEFIDFSNENINKLGLENKYNFIKEKDYIIVTFLKEYNSSFSGILRSYVYCK